MMMSPNEPTIEEVELMDNEDSVNDEYDDRVFSDANPPTPSGRNNREYYIIHMITGHPDDRHHHSLYPFHHVEDEQSDELNSDEDIMGSGYLDSLSPRGPAPPDAEDSLLQDDSRVESEKENDDNDDTNVSD